ncbi:hypothetical protein FUA23_05050 [Neolewinella aurantiaca]|uniref:Cytochrome c domain-containing protein n=1 Tax=Neolewinella aurantiaca TaxID=2602767 RepID=A0A5C7FYQ7_9BACT|nr:di-heme-cytochrome C peroxidase [Neolewinella aurantiaca]TXF90809.1 hypothetical protein FUA23_05050 [Neolewinella aurantiaca]
MKKLIVAVTLLVLTITACKVISPVYNDSIIPDLVVVPADGEVDTDWTRFDQGWDWNTSNAFWFTSQGAEVLPYTWFTWLEQPNNQKLFRNTEHMEMLGYLPALASRHNPAGLPIGFAITRSESMKEAYVGFTCAACHTNMIEHDGEKFIIDGAPTLANFVLLYDRLVGALEVTYKDDMKFERFSNRVLGRRHSKEEAEELREELLAAAKGAALRKDVNALPEHYPEDFTSWGRLDAFTNIMNAGTAFALNKLDNKNYPVAPVSYPFLWGTHQSDFVQWNGGASNIPRSVGPMVRNAGEVVGVFGGLTIKEKPNNKKGFDYFGTLDFQGLGRVEGFVKSLKAPQWDDPESNLPAVDPERVARGEILYRDNCIECHKVVPKDMQYKNYKADMVPLADVGTDPMTAWAAENYMASSGILKGSKAMILKGDVMGDTVQAITIPVNGVAGLVLRSPTKVMEGIGITRKMGGRGLRRDIKRLNQRQDSLVEANTLEAGHQKWENIQNTETKLIVDSLEYKARPLNGIWATAPYLHNGSVPNLWELLKAPKDRVKSFWVGSRVFDPRKVGFVSNRGKNEFKVYREVDGKKTMMLGNSNLGHDYAGGQYTDEQKWDLIEYMKTL